MPGQTIGVIGLGIMGSAVSANLLKDGFAVIGYGVLTERVRALETQGGRGATSVRALAEKAPVMISLLPSVHALEDVVSGDKGAGAGRPRRFRPARVLDPAARVQGGGAARAGAGRAWRCSTARSAAPAPRR